MTDKQICPCSALDWRDCDMRLEHHPDCKWQYKPVSRQQLRECLTDSSNAIPSWYLRFNETSGAAAVDSSGNKRNGTYFNQVIACDMKTTRVYEDGELKHLTFHDHALSAEEIREHYEEAIKPED